MENLTNNKRIIDICKAIYREDLMQQLSNLYNSQDFSSNVGIEVKPFVISKGILAELDINNQEALTSTLPGLISNQEFVVFQVIYTLHKRVTLFKKQYDESLMVGGDDNRANS